jgi:hypothetical protein
MAYSESKLKSNGDKASPCSAYFEWEVHQTSVYYTGFSIRFI